MADEVRSMEMLEAEMKKQEGILSAGLAENKSAWTKQMKAAEEKILAFETEKKGMEKRLSDMEVKANRPDFGGATKPRLATAGQRYVMSEQYQ